MSAHTANQRNSTTATATTRTASSYTPPSGGENKSKYELPGLALKKSASGASGEPKSYVCSNCNSGRCSNCVSLRCQHSCHAKEMRGLEQVKRERQRELSTHRGAPSRF